MKFTHLHTHSHFSLLDGLAKIDQLLDKAVELNMDSLALTDHGNIYGAVEFFQKAKKRGLKPIIGCEVYMASRSLQDKQPKLDEKRYHLVLLCQNEIGYRNLVKLLTTAWLDGFYYKPRIDKALLAQHSQGLIGLSACLAGEIPRAILSSQPDRALKLAKQYSQIFAPGNFYLEIEHHPGIKEQELVNQKMISLAKKTDLPLIATHDIHYASPQDKQAQDILMAVNTKSSVENDSRLSMRIDDFSLQSAAQMVKWFKQTPAAIANSQEIAQKCNFAFQLGQTKLPHFKVPAGFDADSYLEHLAQQGLKKRFNVISSAAEQRLAYELSIIKKTGFASYFLIVQDFVNWAKNNGIVVGPGRGSAAGSLVSYALNVTDLDPIKYKLLFERFLNPERISMPDIDLDFADTRRDEVIEYVVQKYGQNRVSQIITFGTMAARGAIRDAGRAMNINYSFCDQLAKMVPFGFSLDQALKQAPDFKKQYDTDTQAKKLIQIAKKLEGVARHASTHACGVVITKDPLDELIPLQHPTQNDDAIVTQYGMHAIEDLGLLKMDFLGLKNLTIIENAINIIKNTQAQAIVIDQIPLDDKKTLQLFQQARTTGVFQLESGGMKKNLKELKPTHFEDIIAMVALYRPGPIELIPDYIARKHGRKKITYLHPKLEPILKNTYGIAVYQEQVLQIVRDLAGFSLGEADVLRKAVGKKIKELLAEQKDKFIRGTAKNGLAQKDGEKIWQFIEPFARYGFNRSHAACYAMIGWQTAYLKAHFPTEFMAALLNAEQKDMERLAFLINEAKEMQIKVLPPDINQSLANFTVINNNQIRFGLKAIKNVGHNIVSSIVKERKANGFFSSISNLVQRVACKDLNKKSMEALIKCGALDELGERNELLYNLDIILAFARQAQKAKDQGQNSLFGANSSLSQGFTLKLEKTKPVPKMEKLSWEKELLGLFLSAHPLDSFSQTSTKIASTPVKACAQKIGQRVKISGIINSIKRIITKNGQPMLFVTLEDQTNQLELVVFPSVLEKTSTVWQENRIILASGRVNDRDGEIKLLCDQAQELI